MTVSARSCIALGLILIAVLPFPSAVAADRTSEIIQLKAVAVEAIRPNANLLPNPSFEKIDANGIPAGWNWDRRNTDAMCTADRAVAHRGQVSVKFTNGTPFGAHVYGSLWLRQPVRLIEGKTYTMSASVRSAVAGAVQLIGGGDWQIRAAAGATAGKWLRVAKTFAAGPKDVDFVLRINVEAPTSGTWIDDVKLEEGEIPTIDPPGGNQDSKVLLEAEAPESVIQGDGPFRLAFTLSAPRAIGGTLETTLESGEPLRQPVSVGAGVWQLLVKGEQRSATSAARIVRVRLLSGAAEIARADALVRFYSPSGAIRRLAALKAAMPDLKRDLDAVKARGQDVSYPLATFTVLDNFLGYVEEDARHGEVQRAAEQLSDLEPMAPRLGRQLKEALAGRRWFAAVPRWTGTSRPQVKGSSFLAPVRLAGGEIRQRPVFFTGYGHFGQVVSDMEKWPAYGTNIIQIEFGPSSVFPAEDKVSDAPMKAMLETLDRAKRSGVAVCLLISPHYFPEWAKAKWPHLRKRREGFLQYCLHAPEGQELLRRYVAAAIAPLKGHPALHSICLSNEPVNEEEPCEAAGAQWHAWLKDRHGDVARLNERYGAKFASLADVPLPSPSQAGASRPLWMDFIRFNQEFFASWHKMLADAVHAAAPGLPVHAKAMTWTMLSATDVKYGVDATLFGRFSNINGNDSVNFYDFEDGEFAQGWTLNAMALDLQRSVLDAPVFNTENHVIADRDTRRVPAEHVRAALWQAAVHGQSATTVWVWERTFDPKSDLAASIMHRPACAEAVGLVSYDLNRAADELTALQRAPPQLLLLQSTTASVWDMEQYSDCLNKLYTALSFTGLKIGFVTERQLESGEIPGAPILFVPGIAHLSSAAAAGLQEFKGRIVFVGDRDLLTHDEYGRARHSLISAERIPFGHRSTARDLHAPVMAKLSLWGIRPTVDLQGADGKPVWGVEWRTASSPQGLIVNLCNYRKMPATAELILDGRVAAAQDVLSGDQTDGKLTLAPLESKLLCVPRALPRH
jgi:hypothetical protein